MPGPSIVETILAAIAALGAGAGGVAIGRRRAPAGSPDDHEQRIAELERIADDHGKLATRVAHLEAQLQLYGERLTQSIERLSDSQDALRRIVQVVADKLDDVRDKVVRIDVETNIERELRRTQRQSTPNMEPPK